MKGIPSIMYLLLAGIVLANAVNTGKAAPVTGKDPGWPTPVNACNANGKINFQRWNNIPGTTLSSLTTHPDFPSNPSVWGTLPVFEVPSDTGDAYGIRVLGFLCVPQTGNYTFWVNGNDHVELWLSTGPNPGQKQKIAWHSGFTGRRQWNKYASQKSAPVYLTQGTACYIEAIMKEGTGSDNMAVGWAKPGQSTTAPSEVIPGIYLLSDEIPPAPPGLPVASDVTTGSFMLRWPPSADNMELAGYDLLLNGVKVNVKPVTDTFYALQGLLPATVYQVIIVARDAAGNTASHPSPVSVSTLSGQAPAEQFVQRTVIANQTMPWDLLWGPDNQLWYTERTVGRVSKVNPATGVKKVMLALGTRMVQSTGQDGLLGMAVHPDFALGKPFVYLAYTYQTISTTQRLTRIERYTYNPATQTLVSPVVVIENLPGSNDHNSGRMAFGPDKKIYYTIGDMGSGQYLSPDRVNNAQNPAINEGKILRLNAEPVNDSWIPEDNPFTGTDGFKTPVYTLGHRNAQGLVWANVNGHYRLYSSEHGPFTDDEINLVEAGKNYGWPNVIGFCDGNYNGRTTGNFTMVNEQQNCLLLNAAEPMKSMFPAPNPPAERTNPSTWPSVAPSGMDFYGSDAIPGWKNSLLVATLKNGILLRYKLSNDGLFIISDTLHYFRGSGRFRDVIVSPDGLKIYAACDKTGNTSGPTGGTVTVPPNPGSILEFTYIGQTKPQDPAVQQARWVEETQTGGYDVYPNPAQSYTVVYQYGHPAGAVAAIIGLNGRLIKTIALNQPATKITTDRIPAGIYLVKISGTGGRLLYTTKLFISK